MYRKFGSNRFEPSSQNFKNHRTENRTDSPKSVDWTELNLNRWLVLLVLGSCISSEPNFGITTHYQNLDLQGYFGQQLPDRGTRSHTPAASSLVDPLPLDQKEESLNTAMVHHLQHYLISSVSSWVYFIKNLLTFLNCINCIVNVLVAFKWAGSPIVWLNDPTIEGGG